MSGKWIKRGKLKFYINGDRVCVSDDWQTFVIVQCNGRKQRIPALIDNIMRGKCKTWIELYSVLSEYDDKTFRYKRIFKMTAIKKEWV